MLKDRQNFVAGRAIANARCGCAFYMYRVYGLRVPINDGASHPINTNNYIKTIHDEVKAMHVNAIGWCAN